MKAITVIPRTPKSQTLREVPEPTLDQIPDGRGVLVKILRVGLDGTDKEITAGEYGGAPPGSDFLIQGHEGLGVVEQVGANVTEFAPGDHVVAIVRHPGSSIYDLIGMADMTTDTDYHEHGINLLHGFLTERYVDRPEYLVKIPGGLKDVAVLLEPTSVIEKGIAQAFEIQRRLRVWKPQRAAVLGAGTIGLLATLGLRLRGLDVTVFGLDAAPYLNSDLAQEIGARYVSTKQQSLTDAAPEHGPFDLIFECTGYSPLVFEAMQVLGKNGVLVLSSVTGGSRTVEVPADAINLGFVLGNKVAVGTVNANREHFEAGVRDIAMAQAQWPGWLGKLMTHPVQGLDAFEKAFELLGAPGVIKVYLEIAPLD